MKLTYIGIPDAAEPYIGLDRGACPVLAGNPLGNWDTFKQDDDGTGWGLNQTRAHTKANEIDEIDAASSVVSHDPAGNLTKSPRPGNWSGTFDYTWDAWNRLVAVTARGTNIAFAYDGQHKRITKTASGITRHFYYSVDWQILEERLDEETEPLRQYVWSPNPDRMDDLVLRDEGADGSGSSSSGTQQRLYALNDLMNVTAIADDDGNVVERYGYTPFGESRVMDAGFGPRTSSDFDWELRYKMYPLDLESGLYQVRYRYLHPGLGRWMSRDPIGYRGGLNLYGFVGNNPVVLLDYLGLSSDDDNKPSLPKIPWKCILLDCGLGQLIDSDPYARTNFCGRVKKACDNNHSDPSAQGCSYLPSIDEVLKDFIPGGTISKLASCIGSCFVEDVSVSMDRDVKGTGSLSCNRPEKQVDYTIDVEAILTLSISYLGVPLISKEWTWEKSERGKCGRLIWKPCCEFCP